jgi:hypothetical protein
MEAFNLEPGNVDIEMAAQSGERCQDEEMEEENDMETVLV